MCGRSFLGKRHNLDASDMCTCVLADTASLASPAMPRSHPVILLLPCAKLKLLALLSSVVLRAPPRARLSFCMFEVVSQARCVRDGRSPRGMRNEQIFRPSSLLELFLMVGVS